MSVPDSQIRKKWKNYVGDQMAEPLKYFKPSSLSELIDIVVDAKKNGYKAKAIGSGHSSSDIAITSDYMIDTHGLCTILDITQMSLRENYADKDNLFFVEGGIVLKNLIEFLDEKGKALINMGAYTGQTIAGVVSTATHGSGIKLGAFPEYIEAILLLDEDGVLHHIEPSPGRAISASKVKFSQVDQKHFIQSDEDFNAIGVSIGCMGIIYAVVIRVTDSYQLRETRRFSNWQDVKKELAKGTVLQNNRHYEVLVSPYNFKNKGQRCLVTERNIPVPALKNHRFKRGHRNLAYELILSVIPDFILDAGMRIMVNHFPKIIPGLVQSLISTLSDKEYVDKSFKVLDLGKANNLAAYATEIALPSDTYLAAVEEIISVVNTSVKNGGQYLTAPFSLRFVKTNSFYLAMQYGTKPDDFVCMIEFPTVSKTMGGMELLARIESALYSFGGIPHWGQVNHVGGTQQASLEKLYPEFQAWMRVYKKYCKTNLFQNDFSRRCTIEV